ncbi:MAG: phosphatidylcholine/phosphatidylserine synthase [Alphaproteobacteria bacterium]|nr:MAG: phosphatidylcholine/phosphatidylserine synthase [Alphaproteobacteria bacterium]
MNPRPAMRAGRPGRSGHGGMRRGRRSSGGPGGRGPRLITVRALAANIVTTLALSAGMTAIRFALEGRFKSAVTAIIIAGILDGLDGTIARLLKSASRFGAELDSLSDVVAFGIAPAVLIYSWGLADLGRAGWIVALAYGVACALRLARYNAQAAEGGEDAKRHHGFFVGVPAPAGAALVLLPMIVDFAFEMAIFKTSAALGVYVAIVAGSMVSTLPTFSMRQFRIQRENMLLVLLSVAVLAAALLAYGWSVLALIIFCYLVSIPLAFWRWRRLVRAIPPPADDGPSV